MFLSCVALGQQSPDEIRTRQMWNADFEKQRPGAAKKPASQPVPALVGVTLWRMSPSLASDPPAVRSLIHEGGVEREMTPERIAADTPLLEDQMVRLGIETARAGYLYVVDQDQFADKSKSDPYLIFPTMRLRGGDNHVMAGILVEVPAVDDKPPYYRVKRARPDQVAELITILITQQPIKEVKIGTERQTLSAAQLAGWEKQWAASTYKLEAPAQVGKHLTVEEKDAAAGKKKLAPGDPLPQTMYRVDAKAGSPLLIHLPLQISK